MTIQGYQAIPAGLANGAAAAGPRAQGLCVGVHAFSKMGKSSLGASGPRPVLLMDVESAGNWVPGRKIFWEPSRQTVPAWDGSWDIAIVPVMDPGTLFAVQKTLMSGQHQFNSISVDSVPAVAHRAMMAMAGRRKMERDDWGQLLRDMIMVIIGFKDLLVHPVNPVWAITYVFPTHYDQRTRKWRPWMQGQSADLMPYQFDLLGWMYTDGAHPDGQPAHHLFTGPSKEYETGDRLWGRLPHDMIIGHPGMVPGWDLSTMVEQAIASQQQA